jgi:hypothetical protein
MSHDTFWATIDKQLEEASTAATAEDVLRIFATAGNPYGDPHISGAPGFFAGGGGDGSLRNALANAGWRTVWAEASYHWAMRAPDGTGITYIEGDLYPGTGR